MTLAFSIVAICLIYASAFVAGWHLTKRRKLDLAHLVQAKRTFTDPITSRFQQWHDRVKIDALRQRQWGHLWLLISANNLLAVAFVSRTLYGITLVLPVYFTYRQGLGHGAVFAQPSMRPQGVAVYLTVLEFGAYLLAMALGVNLVAAPLMGGALTEAFQRLVVFYPIVATAMLVGAWLEVRHLRQQLPSTFDLPAGLSMEEMRAEAREMLKRQANDAAQPRHQRGPRAGRRFLFGHCLVLPSSLYSPLYHVCPGPVMPGPLDCWGNL